MDRDRLTQICLDPDDGTLTVRHEDEHEREAT
jgi:hypothetical protein